MFLKFASFSILSRNNLFSRTSAIVDGLHYALKLGNLRMSLYNCNLLSGYGTDLWTSGNEGTFTILFFSSCVSGIVE